MTENQTVKISEAKGRPMLHWVGKRPLDYVTVFPAQLVERFDPTGAQAFEGSEATNLLFGGDNKDILAWLLAHGYRGQVNLVYIDPPFDSGADYVRRVHLRGVDGALRLEGETYTLGEQIQYTDIWANDTYLQFMYERLLLLKELLANGGTIFVHCDPTRGHYLRCLMDEVFGIEGFINEVVWSYRRWPSTTKAYQAMHDLLLVYCAGDKNLRKYNQVYEEPSESYLRRFGGKTQMLDEETGTRKITLEEDTKGMPLRDVWELSIVAGFKSERTSYPTQKPESLLERVISTSSNPGDLVLDCFAGSGTTASVAQKLGRRWIASDINKGSVQTISKRLRAVIRDQLVTASQSTDLQPALPTMAELDAPPPPASLAFAVYRVNDYDLALPHLEVVQEIQELIGFDRLKTDVFFDGTLGKELVKVVPFNHPISLIDLQLVDDELKVRPNETRDVVVIGLGSETRVEEWLETSNRQRPVNRIRIIDVRTDQKYGKFIMHQPARARVKITRAGSQDQRIAEVVVVEIEDFISPTIAERLQIDTPVLKVRIPEWRAMVDVVLIDTAYDGEVFNIALSDVPERKNDLVLGRYELPAPASATTVAVKIIDMLGEEVLVTAVV